MNNAIELQTTQKSVTICMNVFGECVDEKNKMIYAKSYRIKKYVSQIVGVNMHMIEMIKPMPINPNENGLTVRIILFDSIYSNDESYDDKTNNFYKILNAWNQNGGLPKLIQKVWKLSHIPMIRIDDCQKKHNKKNETIQTAEHCTNDKSEHSLRTEKCDDFIYGKSEGEGLENINNENAATNKRSLSDSMSSMFKRAKIKTMQPENKDVEHSESRILHTAELRRVGTTERIKDFVEDKPEKGHKITSSVFGDLHRDSTNTNASSETERDSETEEGSDIDAQMTEQHQQQQQEEDKQVEEPLEISISIPTDHEHMVSEDDVMNAIDAMSQESASAVL